MYCTVTEISSSQQSITREENFVNFLNFKYFEHSSFHMILCKSYPCAIWKLFCLRLNIYVKFYVKRNVIFVIECELVRKYRTGRKIHDIYIYIYIRVYIYIYTYISCIFFLKLLFILSIPILRFALQLKSSKILVPSSC